MRKCKRIYLRFRRISLQNYINVYLHKENRLKRKFVSKFNTTRTRYIYMYIKSHPRNHCEDGFEINNQLS